MIKKKLKLYYRATVQIFFKSLYGKLLISNKSIKFIKKEKINISPYKKYDGKNYNIYIVKKARIFTDNNENVAIIKNNFLLPYISYQQINGQFKNFKHNSALKKGTPSFTKKIKGKIFNLCQGDSGNNYFHFIFDILPKIYLLNSKINLKKIDYFYVSDLKSWQIKIFNIIGIKKKNC